MPTLLLFLAGLGFIGYGLWKAWVNRDHRPFMGHEG